MITNRRCRYCLLGVVLVFVYFYRDVNAFLKHIQLEIYNRTLSVLLQEYEEYCGAHLTGQEAQSGLLPYCPCVPPGLGESVQLEELLKSGVSVSQVAALHPELNPGGVWRPQHCHARQTVALIIPYRGRPTHVPIFMAHIHPILQSQQLDYRVFLVEQAEPEVFNKAALMNSGFVEAMKIFPFDCIIFHDIDMLPEDERNMYTCRHDAVIHLAGYVDTFYYIIDFPMLGGAVAMTPHHFEAINGFSNRFVGWGGEDDDLRNRVKNAGIRIWRPPLIVARYTMIKHQRDKGNPVNPDKNNGLQKRPDIYSSDGLSELKTGVYSVLAMEEKPLYTWLHIKIPYPKYWTKSS